MNVGDRAQVADLYRAGLSVRAIASRLGLSKSAVARAVGGPRRPDARFIEPDELSEAADTMASLYLWDGSPNALTLFRLRYGDGCDSLTPQQRKQVAEAQKAWDEQNPERARGRWHVATPPTPTD